jgi:hypothetical protein
MSSHNNKEFSFQTKCAKTLQFTGDVKLTILQQYDLYTQLKTSDAKIKYMSESQDNLSKEILSTITLLQKAEKPDAPALHDKLNHMTEVHKKLKSEFTDTMKDKLNILYKYWPDIFDKVLEGIDRDTLENVLSVYDTFSKGQISDDQAVNLGVDYMTKKYKLPNDFFDRTAVKNFTKSKK